MKQLLIKFLNKKAVRIMSRPPDVVIGNHYLHRWWVIPRNSIFNIYLHRILHSDDDRALHDHPWVNCSILLDGQYKEITPGGSYIRRAGDMALRSGKAMHRLEVIPGFPSTSLFITGPRYRQWGFACPQGWRHWKIFTNSNDKYQVGPGCD